MLLIINLMPTTEPPALQTAFDAHIYGSGLGEEAGLLFSELLFATIGGAQPFTANAFVLQQTWANKWGHSWGDDAGGGGRNNHCVHHIRSNVGDARLCSNSM